MNELVKVFECEEFGKVRTVVRENEIWFVAKDIATILGYQKLDAMYRILEEDEQENVNPQGFPRLNGNVLEENPNVFVLKLINESGLYNAVFNSRKPEAKRFKKWVTSEVLPSIRKNGGYIVEKEDDTDDDILARALVIAQDKIRKREERIKALENRVEVDQPKVEYYEKVINSNSTFTTTQIAKELSMSARKLNLILADLGIQFKQSKQWLLYSKYQDKGYMKTRTNIYIDSNGVQQTNHISVWTEFGREFIHNTVEYL